LPNTNATLDLSSSPLANEFVADRADDAMTSQDARGKRPRATRSTLVDPAIASRALEATLEAIQTEAFIFTERGEVVMSNDAGHEHLGRGGCEWLAKTHRVTLGTGTETPDGFRVSPIKGTSSPKHFLAVRLLRTGGHSQRLELARERWGLSSRQIQIMQHLAWGHSNRDIADTLNCSQKTVELHVSNILKKAKLNSRAEAVAAFWQDR